MALTLKAVNAEITKRGLNLELFKGQGYFYFSGDACNLRQSTSVMVNSLNQLTLEQWVEEAVEMAKPSSSYIPVND